MNRHVTKESLSRSWYRLRLAGIVAVCALALAWVPRAVGTILPDGRARVPYAVSVTPDGDTMAVLPNTSASVTFTVTNTGTHSNRYWISCLTAGCGVSPFYTAFLSGSQSTTVTISGASGAAGTVARVALKAADNLNGVLDSGWVNLAAIAPSAPVVTPDGTSETGVTPSAAHAISFQVRNPGTIATTYTVVPSCSGAAASGGDCEPSTTSLPLNPGDSAAVSVTYLSGGYSTSGRISLASWVSNDATAIDSGWVDISTVPGTPAIAVSPDNGSSTGITANASASD